MKTPWANWIRIAKIYLNISPKEFWDLSLFEWLALNQQQNENSEDFKQLKELMDNYGRRK